MSPAFLGNHLIAELISDPARFKREGRAYQLLEQYFSGLPIETLRPLLRHENNLVRDAALWVTSELGGQAHNILDDVIPLISSLDRFQSYHALEIAAVCAVGDRANQFIHVVAALKSGDCVIRRLVMRLMTRADDSQLEAAVSSVENAREQVDVHTNGLRLLRSGETVGAEEVCRFLSSDSAVARRYGAIAAKRLCAKYPDLLKIAGTIPDEDIRKFACEAV